ncbi:MAG: hypothetical protein US42_C0009G0003 [Candidatus Magasanikbacteria bacterium GW2011_GWC2_37_14]|uniref:Septum formation initiator n=1 Tax=Candidatus Magasanikbacteria bacterium GW2011_GWC2_37_14 TaxID=1619046 RepID=A0A0G0G8J9_9BACT|nr:MAG: hypothetical protein US42_C0009G0003 [Candidatus Magasanikbacteria bacterium GW2011_GWC2_37_14]
MKRTGQSFIRRFFASRLFLVAGLLLLSLIAFGFARAYYQDYRLRNEIKSLQEQAKQLEKKRFESVEFLKYVSSPSFVEETARTELNMKKPGENVLIVTDTAPQKTITSSTTEEKVILLNNPIKWWYYFTHKSINN